MPKPEKIEIAKINTHQMQLSPHQNSKYGTPAINKHLN